jgi:hypothetical protein
VPRSDVSPVLCSIRSMVCASVPLLAGRKTTVAPGLRSAGLLWPIGEGSSSSSRFCVMLCWLAL